MSPPKPYHDEDGITIYHGDCREILPALKADAIITGIEIEERYCEIAVRRLAQRVLPLVTPPSTP